MNNSEYPPAGRPSSGTYQTGGWEQQQSGYPPPPHGHPFPSGYPPPPYRPAAGFSKKSTVGLLIVLAGASLLTTGLFLPLGSIQGAGSVRFSQAATLLQYPGTIAFAVLTLALIGIIVALAIFRLERHAIWPGIIMVGLLVFAFTTFERALSALMPSYSGEGYQSMIFNFEGWSVLIVGTLLVVAGGIVAFIKFKRGTSLEAYRAAHQ